MLYVDLHGQMKEFRILDTFPGILPDTTKTASEKFFVIPGKVSLGKPIITYFASI